MSDLETRLMRAMLPKYMYRVVAGAAQFGADSGYSLKRACAFAEEIAKSNHGCGVVELERVLELPLGGRRYWRMRGTRWVLFDATDADERKPARSWDSRAIAREEGRIQ